MNWLNFDLKKILLIGAMILLPLISINTQQRPGESGWYNKPFTFMASIVESSFFSFNDGVRGTTKLYLDLINLKKESFEIKKQNNELTARLQVMDELQKENERLNSLLEFKQKTKMHLVAARVVSKDPLSDHSTIRIDKGSRHGLKAGMAVISTQGAVGYIFRPDVLSSHVLLVTDRYAVIDGLVSRSRARGIVEGKNSGLCTLRYVEKSEDIQKGDVIVTSGLDNIFPKGFPIATVDEVENKPYAVSLKVELRPVVDPDKTEEVFVITDAQNEDLSEHVTLRQ